MRLINRKRDYAFFILPALIIYTSIILFPIIYSFVLGFFEWDGSSKARFIGLQNYVKMFREPVFWIGLRNNLLIVLVSVLGQIPLGFILAYLIYRNLIRGTQFFQAMIFLPITISAIVVAILWNQIFAPGGIYTSIIRSITGNPRYILEIFQSRRWAIVPILFVILWFYTGIYMVIFIANMKKIPQSLIESAFIDGAKESQVMTRIVLPNLLPVVQTTMIFAIAGSLKSFDLIFAMTGGGPANFTEVIAIFMYINTFKYYNYGYGSAISIIIVVLSLGLITILQYVFSRLMRRY